MNNPVELIKNFMNSKNQNPMILNLINMAKQGNSKGVEDFARNLFKERGKDFDKEFGEFMKQIRG